MKVLGGLNHYPGALPLCRKPLPTITGQANIPVTRSPIPLLPPTASQLISPRIPLFLFHGATDHSLRNLDTFDSKARLPFLLLRVFYLLFSSPRIFLADEPNRAARKSTQNRETMQVLAVRLQ